VSEVYLRDVLDIPESVHHGDFKIDLSKGFTATQLMVDQYVVTDQLRDAFTRALNLVRAAARDGNSHAAYLHGSFGSGKSHFLTVLHAVLNNDPAARAKKGLQPVIAEHDEWLDGRKFLMVPYHLVGAADLDSALLGGYVKTVREQHPDAPTPPVYRADAMLVDAQGLRESLGDDKFAELLGSSADDAAQDLDDLEPLDEHSGSWTPAELDAAFAATAGDPRRDALVSALLSGPMASYGQGARGDKDAFLPLENGLAVISRHAKALGYDGIVLFLDELILWLQAHMSQRDFVNNQVSKLVKLIESGDNDRPVPIVSFISRQRDLTQLIGADVMGADVKNLEQQVQYLAERFDTVSLEDRNLPAIITERVLKPVSEQARAQLDAAFASIESTKSGVKDALLDANGATHSDWSDFRAVYPLSPALLNVLVALSGALQRERTGLKLLQDMLYRCRADMKLGELIPLGDLWDVISEGSTAAFTDRLRSEAEAAQRFHTKARAHLEEKYGSTEDARFRADDRLVKTLLLASLAPDVPALARLTGARLAALNHGSIRSKTVEPGAVAITRLRELQAAFGELRAEGDQDPVFALHLSDLDIEPFLDAVNDVDTPGARRIWIKDQLWKALGVRDDGAFVCEREVVWRGSKRVAEFVFENVRDRQTLPTAQFAPSLEGRIRFVVDYPFDDPDRHPSDDLQRVDELQREGMREATIVWLPSFLSDQRQSQLGRLLRINYLLTRDRIDDYASTLSSDDRIRVKHQLQAQRDSLTSQLVSVLGQLYGIARAEDANIRAHVSDDGHVFSLFPGHDPRLHGGASFEYNTLALADHLFAAMHPKHPDFDPKGERKALTTAELRNALNWITKAAEQGGRVELDRGQLAPMKKIVHPLGLGEVHDGPLTLDNQWRLRIDQHASRTGATGDYAVEDIRKWIDVLGVTGLDKQVANLIIASYALLADRAWVYQGVPKDSPDLSATGAGWALRAQELPSEDEFERARNRAGVLFGVTVPSVRFARNVAKLATSVGEKVREWEPAVFGVHKSLSQHADNLGIDRTAPPVIATRNASELLATLSAIDDPTRLARTLADLPDLDSDTARSRTITSAPELLRTLDSTEWDLLNTIRQFLDRSDGIRDRSERLLAEIGDAANADEFTSKLAPVLRDARPTALRIIQDAAAAQPTTTEPVFPPAPVTPPPPEPPAPPPTRRVRRVSPSAAEGALTQILSEMRDDIAQFAEDNPGVAIEIDWRPVEQNGQT
jgi:hypothetical protein